MLAQPFSPDPDWRFDNFNSQNHFNNHGVNNIVVDKHGYVWVCGTGLQRFDGYKTIDFNNYSQGGGALRTNSVDMVADSYGRLWVSSGGLCYYDDAGGKFVYLDIDAKHKINGVNCLFSQKNNLWFVNEYGLVKLDVKTLKFSFTALKSVNNPLATFQLDDTTLLVSSRDKIYTYNIKRNTYIAHTLIYNQSLPMVYVAAKIGGDIFLGTNVGLFSINDLDDMKGLKVLVKDVGVEDMTFLPEDKGKKHLFLGTVQNGLMVYNVDTKKIECTFRHDDNNLYSVPANEISKFCIGADGRLWMGTAVGISMLDVFNQQMRMRFLNNVIKQEPNINKIATDKTDSSKVWMSCADLGMIRMDWKTKAIEKVINTDPDMNKIIDFVQVSKYKWILVTGKKVMEWNPEKGIFAKTILPVPDSIRLVYFIRKIILTDKNTCFITSDRGLYKYNLVTSRITAAAKTSSKKVDELLKYNLMNGFNDNGLLWIASRNGLFNYNTATGTVTVYKDKGKYLDYFFFDAAPAINNQVVCASSNGIAIFNKSTKTFRIVDSLAKLFHPGGVNVVCKNNMVWVATESGLVTYNLSTNKSAMAEKGAPLVETLPNSPFVLIGDNIVLGYNKGYVYFKADVKKNLLPSDPIIEHLYVNNQTVSQYNPTKENMTKLIFSHQENSININFTAFLYPDPDHINFRYKLIGADPNWQLVTDQRSANYAQLSPGDYTFYVQSGDKNGTWNKHLASVRFVIDPPYWETWWFRSLAIAAVALLLYQLYLYKINHIRAIESIRQNIASDFHDDLGSTLSSISIFSEVAVKKAETDLAATKSMLGDIGVRARAMIHSMNDMVWIIKPENDNLYRLMQRMEEFGYPVAEAKDINLAFLMDESIYDVKTDMLRRKNLFLVFKEAFNNAVKYSHASNIEVIFELKQKNSLVMKITDNGSGFEYNNKKPGNGLGNMQKRAEEINGRLKITTAPGAGTSINIVCKIT